MRKCRVIDLQVGSPPHTRGISKQVINGEIDDRLTPAYAGNITKIHGSPLPVQAHPRIRGEYAIPGSKPGADGGSPPHTRGIFSAKLQKSSGFRLTPAYVGNIEQEEER